MKILKKFTSIILSIILILTTFLSVPTTQAGAANNKAIVKLSGECRYDYAYEILNLVNEVRSAKGLNKLKMDKATLSYAMQRAAEIAVKYDHTRPNGSYCLDKCDNLVAENIGVVYTTPDSVMKAWINSPKHYANIISSNCKSIGVGVVFHNNKYYWVQDFSDTTASTTAIPENTTKQFSIDFGSNSYSLHLSVDSKFFCTDQRTIQIIGENSDCDLEYVLDVDTFDFSSDNSNVVTFSSNTVIGNSAGSTTITAKCNAVTVTKKVTVVEFGAGKSKKCGDNITWKYNNGTLILDGYGRMYDYTAKYDNINVTSTDVLWADALKTVDKIVVSEGITYIGNSAFAGFEKLTDIALPTTLTQIGSDVFAHCSSLSNITIPDSVTDIGNNAFYKCMNLTSVNLSSNLKSISQNMFYRCDQLEHITIPDSVETIEQSAFAYCAKLNISALPNNLRCIETLAFIECKAITSLTIPYGVQSIDKKAFIGCKALKKVTILDPSTKIALEGVFSNTSSSLTISGYNNSTAEIFCKNNGIKFNTISGDKAVVSAEDLTFTYTGEPVTENITVNVQNAPDDYVVRFSRGSTFDFDTSFESIEQLGKYFREDAPYNIKIKDYLVASDSYPISYCVYSKGSEPVFGLVNITIQQEQTIFKFEQDKLVIPWYTKGDNSNGFVNPLSYPDDIDMLDIKFSTDNTNILAVDFRGRIVAKRYGECTVTATFNGNENYTADSASYKVEIYPVGELVVGDYFCEFMDDQTVVLNRYYGKEKVVLIPDKIAGIPLTTIKPNAFYSGGYEEIIVPQGINEICNNAFTSCYMLNSLTIPDTVTTIGDHAFNGCKELKSVTIPASVTHIEVEAFGYTNPDVDKVSKKIDRFVIYGYRNTAAHSYAVENGFEFVALDEPEHPQGDVDKDNKVSVMDATAIQLYKALMYEFDQEQIGLADFTSDGSVDILDATAIQLTLVGLL